MPNSFSFARVLFIALLAYPASVWASPITGASGAAESNQTATEDLSLVQLLELKIATTKTATSVEESPANVTVITREEILDWQYQSLADVLQHVTGFYVVDDHIAANVGVRGMAGGLGNESGTIKVMIDGVPVTFHPTGGNWLGPELIPLSAVERIEIVRGPTSSLYGADAFLGVVNVITRDGDIMRGADVRVGGSMTNALYPGYDLDATVGAPLGPFELLLGTRYNFQDRSCLVLPRSSPAPRLPEMMNAYEPTRDQHLRSLSGLARATWHARRNLKVSLTGRYALLERNAEFAPWLHLSSTADDPTVAPTRVSLDQLSLTLGANWQPVSEVAIKLHSTAFEDGPTGRDQVEVGSDLYWVKRRFGSRGLSSTLEANIELLDNLQMVAGVEHSIDREQPLTGTHVPKIELPGIESDGSSGTGVAVSSRTLQNFGALSQFMWTPHERVATTAGFRYDEHSIYGGQPSGRGAIVLTAAEGLFLKLMAGTAFKAPSPSLLYDRPIVAGGVVGNPELKPQRLSTAEGQFVYRFSDRLSATTGVSYNVLTDKAQFTLVGLNQEARNLAKIESWSWETRMDANLAADQEVFTSWERVWAHQKQDDEGYRGILLGTDNAAYPKYIFRAGLSSKLPGLPLRFNTQSMLVTERLSSDDNTFEAGERYALPPYLLVDAGLSTHDLNYFGYRETRVSLVARNLFNSKVSDPGFSGVDYPLQQRTFFLQVRQEL